MGSGVGPQQQRALYGPGLRHPSSCQLGDAPWLGASASQSALPHATPLPATRARECPNNPEAQAAAARVLDPPTPAAIIASQQRAHPTALAGSLVQLLAGCLEAAPRSSGPASYSAVLCGPVQHYSASLYSAGWGCGYNNMQMMAAHLLAARPVGPCRTRELQRLPAMQGCCSRPGSAQQAHRLLAAAASGLSHLIAARPGLPACLQEAREVLFGGAGWVPDIPALQAWLGGQGGSD